MVDGYFLHLNWRNEHNHRLACAAVLCAKGMWRHVPIIKLMELYEKGLLLSVLFVYFLLFTTTFVLLFTNVRCPQYSLCFTTDYKTKYSGESTALHLVRKLWWIWKQRVDKFNQEYCSNCAQMESHNAIKKEDRPQLRVYADPQLRVYADTDVCV